MTGTGLSPAHFHEQPGVDDWRVTSRGAEAVFRAPSLEAAAALVPTVVATGLAADVDLRPEAVAVRVPFAGDALPPGVVEFAAAVSSSALALGLVPDPGAVQAVDVFVAQHEDADTRPFWAAVLGYELKGDTDAVDPLRRGPGIAVNPIDNGKQGRGRTHIDIHVSLEVARARVEAAVAAGGRLVDDSYAPAWWTLASPDNHGVDVASWLDTWKG